MELNFDFEPKITKNYLLSKCSEETYMQFYLGIQVKKGLFKSPLRKDHRPTCSFYRNKSGELIFKDFSGDFYGNFINVVMYKYHVNYYQALKIIAGDFGYIKTNIPKNKGTINTKAKKFEDKGTTDIRVEIKPYTKKELDWWNSFGITKEILNKYKVFSCKTIFLNGNPFILSSKDSFIFGYYGGKKDNLEYWRIYFPKKTTYRFLTNWPSKKVQGYEQLPKKGNLLVITKSMKDCMCLKSFGINAIAPNSENLFISDNMLKDLKTRFKYIVVFYDCDIPGIKNMRKIKKEHSDLLYFWIPRRYNAKDISDFRKAYGQEETYNFIKEYVLKIINQNE